MFKNLLKETAIYGLSDFFFKFINFALFPFYAYVLSVSEFGVFALITTLTQLLCTIINCGQTYALQRFYPDKNLDKLARASLLSTGLASLVMIGLVLTLTVLGASYYLRHYLMDTFELHWSFVVMGMLAALPYQIFHYCVTSLRINFEPWKFTFFNFLQNALIISLSLIGVFKFNLGLAGWIGSITLANTIAALVCFFSIRAKSFGKIKFQYIKQMMLFGFPFIFSDMANWIYASIDRWMLGNLSTLTAVGYYSMAFKLATLMIFIISAFGLAWNPHAMKVYNDNPLYRSYFSKALTHWFYFLIFISASLSLLSPEILMLLTPPSYWPSAALIPFITLGLAFHGTIVLCMMGLLIEKKTHHLIGGTWLCALINFSLNLFLIPHFGAMGAACASMLTYFLQAAYILYCSQKFHPLPLDYPKLSLCMAASLFITCSCIYIHALEWSYGILSLKIFLLLSLILLGFFMKLLPFHAIKDLIRKKPALQTSV